MLGCFQVRPRDMEHCYNQYEVTRKRDRETGRHSLKFSLKKELKMSIEAVEFTMFNVALLCDVTETPWCDCTNAPPADTSARKALKRDKDVIVPILKRKPY